MESLLDHPLAEVLKHVSATTPAPGGGSSAAVTCALAAGLVQMVAGFSLAHDADDTRMRDVHARAGSLRTEAAALADAELTAYAPVLVAMRRAQDDPDRPRALDAALSQAAETPFAITRAARDVALLGAQATRDARKHLRGDAMTAVVLAEAAATAASRLAAINLAERPDDPRHAQLRALTDAAGKARTEALS